MNKLDPRKTYVRKRPRSRGDEASSRKRGEKLSDIAAAFTVWLLKRCPGYEAELRNCYRGVSFGKKTNL